MNVRQSVLLIGAVILSTEGCKEDKPVEVIPFVKENYTYKSIIIGTQEWMAEDLKNNAFCNDEPIPEVKDATQWSTLEKAGWSYLGNDKENNFTSAKIYNWSAVSDERNICPCGWHVPSLDDLMELSTFLGGEEKAGGAMKAVGSIKSGDSRWSEPNIGATNSSGFSAIPNGVRGADGAFYGSSSGAHWWTSTISILSSKASAYSMKNDSEKLIVGNVDVKYGYAIRCVKD